jgi:HEAT repeat protein
METTQDAHILWQAVQTLENIDPGNPKTIEGLIKVLETTQNDYTRRQAAKRLEKIGMGNPKAI